jgi:hypothetical protein
VLPAGEEGAENGPKAFALVFVFPARLISVFNQVKGQDEEPSFTDYEVLDIRLVLPSHTRVVDGWCVRHREEVDWLF